MRVVATAGHVDHGKSSLIRALTGTDPDRFAEERERGLTIDLGFAHTELDSGEGVSFVDVPGHTRFLGNMLAGVGAVDACVFIVAATEGWMPQSEEHLRILDLLGVEHGFVALTKRDLVDDELAELAALVVADQLAGTFLDGAPIVPVSATTGEGVDDIRAALDELVATTPTATNRGRPRLWIDRSFAAKGSGTVVTGTLAGGELAHDQTVAVEPGGRSARIRGIQTLGRAVERIGPGNRVALNLNGVAHDEVGRGDAVVEPDRWHLTDQLDASLSVLAALDHDVSRRGAYVAYIGARELPIRLRVLGSEALAPGSDGAVRMYLSTALPLLPGDRYVLRESGRDETVGGGEVLDVDPLVKASRAAPDRSIARMVAERGVVTVDELERITGERVEPTVGNWVIDERYLEAMTERLMEEVAEAGALGVDVATLAEYERSVLGMDPEVVVELGRARLRDSLDLSTVHPLDGELRLGGFTPDQPTDRAAVRELVARGILVARDGIVFHSDTIDDAAQVASQLLQAAPDGFTVSEFRDATGTTRKYALPLLAELDARGITRRRQDVRIPGPRLPS